MRLARSLASFLYVVPILLDDFRANKTERDLRRLWPDLIVIDRHNRHDPQARFDRSHPE